MTPKLHPRAGEAVRRLLTETGHVLSVEDFDDIALLNEYAVRAANLDGEPESLLDCPVACGNLLLYELSLGAAIWLEERACQWFEGGLLDLACAYAMAHARQPETLCGLAGRAQAAEAIRTWMRGASCNQRELVATVNRLWPAPVPGPKTKDPQKYGPIIALLCREYGRDPEFWEWKCSLSYLKTMVRTYEAGIEKVVEAQQKATAKHRRPDGRTMWRPAPLSGTASWQWHVAFRDQVKGMRERWRRAQRA